MAGEGWGGGDGGWATAVVGGCAEVVVVGCWW